MKSSLRQIGNSRGVILPAPLLAERKIQDKIEITVEPGRLVITPVKTGRAGWFDGYKPKQDAAAWASMADTPNELEDWEW